MESLIETLNETIQNRDDEIDKQYSARSKLNQKIESHHSNQQFLEDELYCIKKEQYEQKKKFEEAQIKISKLNKYIKQLEKGQAIYYGNKTDRTDIKLAQYINKNQQLDKANMLFLR